MEGNQPPNLRCDINICLLLVQLSFIPGSVQIQFSSLTQLFPSIVANLFCNPFAVPCKLPTWKPWIWWPQDDKTLHNVDNWDGGSITSDVCEHSLAVVSLAHLHISDWHSYQRLFPLRRKQGCWVVQIVAFNVSSDSKFCIDDVVVAIQQLC